MKTHTYLTTMPDKPGAFMAASKIIMHHGGNIIRVSYNKAVDMRMLFIEVQAEQEQLLKIENELKEIGYINRDFGNPQIIVINIKITDKPGSLLPVLEILNSYKVNISYLNSSQDNKDYQDFKMGLYIDDTKDIKEILDEISKIYPVEIINYEDNGTVLDNTIFYIRFGNEIQKLFNLDNRQTVLLIKESNRIMQLLADRGEDPKEVFSQVLHLARFISSHKGKGFNADINLQKLTDNTSMYTIEPPCGSNIFILHSKKKLLFIDTGFAIYAKEMMDIFLNLFPDFQDMEKSILLTHADIDHCGLLSVLKDAKIIVNKKTAMGLHNQSDGIADYREQNKYCLGYSRLSRIFSGYTPINNSRFLEIIDKATPENHDDLLYIGDVSFEDITFKVYEGSGGHVYGEVIFLCENPKIVFTGDIYVNIKGFSKERREFNSIAPYLMTSVDVNRDKANEMRKQLMTLIENKGGGFMICGGHGPVKQL